MAKTGTITPGVTSLLRAGARGLVAAMAMTGVRSLTANAGLIEQSPPEAIIERHGPDFVKRLDEGPRAAVTELAHWSYGAAGGAAFGLLPPTLRARLWMGPLYGLTVWATFELGIAPLLGIEGTTQGGVLSRAMVAMDHALYGFVVAGRLAPDPEVIARERHRWGWVRGHR